MICRQKWGELDTRIFWCRSVSIFVCTSLNRSIKKKSCLHDIFVKVWSEDLKFGIGVTWRLNWIHKTFDSASRYLKSSGVWREIDKGYQILIIMCSYNYAIRIRQLLEFKRKLLPFLFFPIRFYFQSDEPKYLSENLWFPNFIHCPIENNGNIHWRRYLEITTGYLSRSIVRLRKKLSGKRRNGNNFLSNYNSCQLL